MRTGFPSHVSHRVRWGVLLGAIARAAALHRPTFPHAHKLHCAQFFNPSHVRMLAGAPHDQAPLSKNALKKLKKQQMIQEKKMKKAETKSLQNPQAQHENAAPAQPLHTEDESPAPFGFDDLGLVNSLVDRPELLYDNVSILGQVGGPQSGDNVRVRGRLAALRAGSSNCFMVVRSGAMYTVQACFFKDKERPTASKQFLTQLGQLTTESVIEVEGTLSSAQVTSCSQKTVEIQVSRVRLVSAAAPKLPFEVDDAARSEAEVDASEDTDRPFPRIGQDLRLSNRWIDLRVPAHNGILRVQSAVCAEFRNALLSRGFVELHTPKLVAGESEGGADVFRTDYFGQPACPLLPARSGSLPGSGLEVTLGRP